MDGKTNKGLEAALLMLTGLGFLFLFLIGAGVPVFVLPVTVYPEFQTNLSSIISAKWLMLQGLSAAAIILGGIALITPLWRKIGQPAWLPLAALAAWLIWGTLSLSFRPGPRYTLGLWMPTLLGGLAAMTGVFFLHTTRRVQIMIWGLLISGMVIAAIGVVSSAGDYRGFNRWAYGMDPREVSEDVELADMAARVQGGTRSAAAMSTLGNPEYTGTFIATVAVMMAIVLLDWAPASRRGAWLRVFALVAIPLLLLEIAFSASRAAWIALGLAAALRLFMQIDTPKIALAIGFSIFLMLVIVFGVPVGVLGFALMTLAALLYAHREGKLLSALKGANRFNRILIVGLPIVGLIFLIAFSTPGWWNPTGVRILQRFSSLVSRQDQSLQERSMMYMLASEMVWKNPIFGVGPGRYRNQFSLELAATANADDTGVMFTTRHRLGNKVAEWAHCDYLQVAAETGLVGLTFFLAMLVFLLGGLSRIIRLETGPRRVTALLVFFGLIAYCSIMLSSFPLQMPSRSAAFWMLSACAFGLLAATQAPEPEVEREALS